jgi:hypothetical protein
VGVGCYNFNVISKNKKMTKRKSELKYEVVDRVSRWNYIQFIGKQILESSISNDELKEICLELQSGEYQLALIVNQK